MEVSSAVTNSHLQSAENYILEVWESEDDNDYFDGNWLKRKIVDCNLSYIVLQYAYEEVPTLIIAQCIWWLF